MFRLFVYFFYDKLIKSPVIYRLGTGYPVEVQVILSTLL